ncbi:MAG: serine acetyltransferase [Deltaproteobacteria bacterium]|jgi:serine O-acetyltransferase|nr:serine acetyltransferase [Deltaproteobacteria bacterium]
MSEFSNYFRAQCIFQQDEERYKNEVVPRIQGVADELMEVRKELTPFEYVTVMPRPTFVTVKQIIRLAQFLIFPGFFEEKQPASEINVRSGISQHLSALYSVLYNGIAHSIRHEHMRNRGECANCTDLAQTIALDVITKLPQMRLILASDVEATKEGDPAAGGFMDQIIFCYPGVYNTMVYRLAHELWVNQVPFLPRMMTEYAHGRTGIDIHPGAVIGKSFFIDHGTGVVIGETTVIGERVRLYQGVTLGALSLPRDAGVSLRGAKRHPTLEDDVIVYSGATILGGETVIGARSVIGGNVWLTESIPPDTKVFIKKPELIFVNTKT